METFEEVIAILLGTGLAIEHEVHSALEKGAKIVCQESKDEIGTYQGAAGPTAAWAPLAESTKASRVSQGFTPDEPLLRTGDLRDSITYYIEGDTAYIGSDEEKALWLEVGTPTIPPRSFLEGAAYRKEAELIQAFGDGVSVAISKK